MLLKILTAGSGGQGVLTLGNILGNAAMMADLHVTYLPSYGAAMRGGTANCTVCISDEEVASPVSSTPDILVAMNQPSLIAFITRLEPGGQLIYNADLVDQVPERGDVEMIAAPVNRIARRLGNERTANMVMLGALVKLMKILDIETIIKSIDVMMGSKKKIAETSAAALRIGYEEFPFDQDTLSARKMP
ncbi:MAG: 2-oxoacid:acceptor oxidoreductase family protein [Spirochaetes bacterium]|nr:2-oxoacid:acceptor oxidoreductase family protein [Spirochaetota bacterium]